MKRVTSDILHYLILFFAIPKSNFESFSSQFNCVSKDRCLNPSLNCVLKDGCWFNEDITCTMGTKLLCSVQTFCQDYSVSWFSVTTICKERHCVGGQSGADITIFHILMFYNKRLCFRVINGFECSRTKYMNWGSDRVQSIKSPFLCLVMFEFNAYWGETINIDLFKIIKASHLSA